MVIWKTTVGLLALATLVGCKASVLVNSLRTSEIPAENNTTEENDSSETASLDTEVSVSTGYYYRKAVASSLDVSGTCTTGATVSVAGDATADAVECSSGTYTISVVLSGADGLKEFTVVQNLGEASESSQTYTVNKSSCAISSSFTGNGDDASPFMVCSLEQLDQVRDDGTKVYKLGADIYAASTADWNSGEGFEPMSLTTGKFLGDSKTIYDLTINRPGEDYQALFASIGTGTVSDLILEDVSVSGNNYCAGVEASSIGAAAMTNVHVIGSITCAGNTAGGIIGSILGSRAISGVSFTGAIPAANAGVGGLIGTITSVGGVSIAESWSSGSINCASNCGGLVGLAYGNVTIMRSQSSMDVSSTGDQVGGLVGEAWVSSADSMTITDVYATGDVTGGDFVGGLLGRFWVAASAMGTVFNFYASGSVEATTGHAGGAIGRAWETGTTAVVANGFATGNVTGATNAGGLGGSSEDVTWVNVHYYNHAGNPGVCVDDIVSGTAPCTTTTDITDFYNSGIEPTLSWDFPTKWVMTATLPKLAWE